MPLSIDDLLKQKQESRGSEKPRFLSKEERAKLALERRAKEVAAQKNGAGVDQDSSGSVKFRERDEIQKRYNEDHKRGNDDDEPAKKKKRSQFRFEWSQDDDTYNANDAVYQYYKQQRAANGGKNGTASETERKRSQKEWDDVHWSKKPLERMRERDWRIFKEDFRITTRGGNLPYPLRYWSEGKLPAEITQTIDKLGYKEPTPIQRAAIPVALQHRDVIGVAETGSGKTASFVIPILTYIMELPPLNDLTKVDGPYVIVLAPTRELAIQIETEAQKFCEPVGYKCISVVGGHNIESQAYKIQAGAEIVVATPGRLIDTLDRHLLVLKQCSYVVLDEADRMIDMGFEESITRILSELPASNDKLAESSTVGGRRYRQTMMYTATWPRAIERISERYLRNPAIVTIGSAGQATDRVEQRVEYIIGEAKRVKRLIEFLDGFKPPIIVFVNLVKSADQLAKELNNAGWKTVTMHGHKTQDQREAALAQLRRGTAHVLVATDVAGRGIDIPDVSLVVNFQMSKTIEPYTHRIGRTGRAGRSGVALTFIGPEDTEVLYDLRQIIINSPNSARMPPELRAATRRALPPA